MRKWCSSAFSSRRVENRDATICLRQNHGGKSGSDISSPRRFAPPFSEWQRGSQKTVVPISLVGIGETTSAENCQPAFTSADSRERISLSLAKW
jgi:hypothetical protein